MKVSQKTIFLFLAMLIWTLYCSTIEMTAKFFPFPSYSLPVLFFAAFILVFANSSRRVFRMGILVFPLMMMIVVLSFNNNLHANKIYTYSYLFCSLMLAFPFLISYDDWQPIALRLFIGISLFYAVMTFVIMLSPDLWNKLVYPNLSAGYQNSSKYGMQNNFSSAFGFTSNAGTNAMYLTPGLLAAVSMLLTSKKDKIRNLLVCLLMLGASLATGKRAFIAFEILSVMLTYYVLHSYEPVKRWVKIIFWTSVLAAAYFVLADYLPFLYNVIDKITYYAQTDRFDAGRDLLRLAAWQFFQENKFFGIGWCGFQYHYDTYVAVHNVYLQLLCEVGIIGSAPFFLFFGTSIFNAFRDLQFLARNKMESQRIYLFAFSFSVQVFFLLYCLTGNPLYDPPMLFSYIISTAISAYFHHYIKGVTIYEMWNPDIL